MSRAGINDIIATRAEALRQRARWLTRPWFLAVVVTLLLNDHVLKSRYSTWWTGKLSDVAGVAMIAVLAAIILGSRRGPLVAAAAFTAVKTVPGLAELAAPILGGTTLRDATDLIALAVVPLVVVLLERGHGRHPAPHQPSARCRSTSLRILATIGLAGSVVATTATSCDPDDGVQTVIAEDGRLYAAYGSYWGHDWLVSDDGITWTDGAAPRSVAEMGPPPTNELGGQDLPGVHTLGSSEHCVGSACWRVDGTSIERFARGEAESNADIEYTLSADRRRALNGTCVDEEAGILASIAAIDRASGDGEGQPIVVASLGLGGVMIREADGTWTAHAVREADALQRHAFKIGWFVTHLTVAAVAVGASATLARRGGHGVLGSAATTVGAFLLGSLFGAVVGLIISWLRGDHAGSPTHLVAITAFAIGVAVAELLLSHGPGSDRPAAASLTKTPMGSEPQAHSPLGINPSSEGDDQPL